MIDTSLIREAIQRIENVDFGVDFATPSSVADALAMIRDATVFALTTIVAQLDNVGQSVPRHGNDKHNQAMYCSCEKCI